MSPRAVHLRRRLAPAALATLALAGACASPGSPAAPGGSAPPPSVTSSGATTDVSFAPTREAVSNVVQATPEAAWEALAKAYADLGIPVRERSDATRTLGNSRLVLSRRLGDTPLSRYLECGSGITGPFADRYRIEMLIRSAVAPAPQGGVLVETYLEATGRNPEGSSNTGVACATTARLEREIAARVRFHVGGGR